MSSKRRGTLIHGGNAVSTNQRRIPLVFLVVALLLAACGSQQPATPPAAQGGATAAPQADSASGGLSPDIQAKLVLYDFGDTNDRAVRQQAIDRFNKRFPNVTVDLQFTPIKTWSEYLEKLVTQVAGGTAPDVVHIATEGVRLAVDKNLVMPLSDLAANDPDGKALLDDVDPTLVKSYTVNDKLYLVPAAWNNMMIYYNTKVFQEAGIERPADDWTWDDFLAIAKKLTKGEGADQTYGYGIPYFNFGIHPWFLSSGAPLLKNDLTESNLNDPKVAEAAQFLHDLVHVHKVSPDPFSTDPNAVYQQFSTGKIGMTGGGHWPMQFFISNNFKDYDVLPWPQHGTKATVFGADGYGIYPETKQKELAWELIKELTSKETMLQTVSAGVAIPARRSVAESKEFLAQPAHADLFYKSLAYAQPVTAPANFNDMETIFMRHMDQLMSNELPAQEAMQAAHDELAPTLKK
jgi:multiple sugar transport system substrate-binding protein